jgi:hypothetical protein
MTGDGPPNAAAVVAAFIAAVTVLVIELSAAIRWLGGWFDTMDSSAVLPQP